MFVCVRALNAWIRSKLRYLKKAQGFKDALSLLKIYTIRIFYYFIRIVNTLFSRWKVTPIGPGYKIFYGVVLSTLSLELSVDAFCRANIYTYIQQMFIGTQKC